MSCNTVITFHKDLSFIPLHYTYKRISIISGTVAAIGTAVVAARAMVG
jgi:hypothetical protein